MLVPRRFHILECFEFQISSKQCSSSVSVGAVVIDQYKYKILNLENKLKIISSSESN